MTFANLTLPATNFTLHALQRRHTSYVNFYDVEACNRKIEQLQNHTEACAFILKTKSCSDIVNLFDYLAFMVCEMKIPATDGGCVAMVLVMLIVLAFYTAFLYVISAYFILPNVIHVSQYVHVSLYDYGVSTIAVILAAPDVLWVLQKCHQYSQNGTLLLSLMLGKSFTTYTVGLAVICLRGQTRVPGFDFCAHTFFAMIVFIFSTLVLQQKMVADNKKDSIQSPLNIRGVAFMMTVVYVAYTIFQILTRRRPDHIPPQKSKMYPHSLITAHKGDGWLYFFKALNPYEHMHLPKWLVGLLSTFYVLAALQIPVVNKKRPMYGWCKYLTCINVIIFPWQAYFVKNTRSVFFFGCVYFVAVFIVVVTIAFTLVNNPPKFQGFYAIVGIIFGLSTYHIVSTELEAILWQVSNYIFLLPRDIIMLTGFVVNYLLNVVIFGYELVKQGYGNLACGVVVGIVLNQSFLILPVVVFQFCYDIQSLVAISANTWTCLVFMLIVMMSTTFALGITNFKIRLSQGVYLFMLYGLFLLYLILTFAEKVHPYGGFHSVAVEVKKERSLWAR